MNVTSEKKVTLNVTLSDLAQDDLLVIANALYVYKDCDGSLTDQHARAAEIYNDFYSAHYETRS